MRTGYLAAIVLAAFVAGTGLAVHSIQNQADYCPQPSAASVTALFAPCQTFDTAMGHAVSKPEAVRIGLLTPAESWSRLSEQNLRVDRWRVCRG